MHGVVGTRHGTTPRSATTGRRGEESHLSPIVVIVFLVILLIVVAYALHLLFARIVPGGLG